jgi:hypothetical protein
MQGRELLVGQCTGHPHAVEFTRRNPSNDERGRRLESKRRFGGIAGDRALVPISLKGFQ